MRCWWGRDGDGYVEYATRSTEGLGNQCWRDSWDGVRFADGHLPVLPIATCEIQGSTVWPHNNAIAVAGLAWYGYRAEANRVAPALLDVAAQFDYRLPEALAGYPRDRSFFAVPYPTACSPQAWASGAPLTLARALLGLHPADGQLLLDPQIPDEIGRVTVTRLNAFGRYWDIEAAGATGSVRPSPD